MRVVLFARPSPTQKSLRHTLHLCPAWESNTLS